MIRALMYQTWLFLSYQLGEQRLNKITSSPHSPSGSSFRSVAVSSHHSSSFSSPLVFPCLQARLWSLYVRLPPPGLELAESSVLVLGLMSACDLVHGESLLPGCAWPSQEAAACNTESLSSLRCCHRRNMLKSPLK